MVALHIVTLQTLADVIINQDGTYLIVAAGQVGKTSGNVLCNVDLWLSQNGEYVANSNTVLQSIQLMIPLS